MSPFDPAPLLKGLTIQLDIDVLIGRYPDRDAPTDTRSTARGATANLRAALFDMRTGNDETLALPDGIPIGVLDLRDPIGAKVELDRLVSFGVRTIRLFPDEQGIEPGFPAMRHVARLAAHHAMTVLTGGDIRRFWQPFSGLGSNVVFLDTHFYHLGDFLLIASDEPGFHTSTRLLTSPDALEVVAAQLCAERLLFGSRVPFYEPLVPMLRLATSDLTAAEKALIAGGNAQRLLGAL